MQRKLQLSHIYNYAIIELKLHVISIGAFSVYMKNMQMHLIINKPLQQIFIFI